MNEILNKIKFSTNNSDIFAAIILILILGLMIVPISPFLLDLFLALTISISMVILLMAIYIGRPLDFSTFPTVLLISTLFRLALNVASTRNILLRSQTDGQSAAGEIIHAFGDFVVGGNYAVGIIVFIIMVIINFVVITKGAGRVAEVGARFTLDAMPGKQMAIDADLNAGLIDDKEAKKRRTEVAAEADFYGSMDGASKFVRGDAIAGILITIINIIGGIIIGVGQYKLSFSEATELYTLLTVGDGLVTQIPAIIISTAAGVIITRNSNDASLGGQMTGQLKVHPKTLFIVAAVLLFFAIFSGLPKIPFLIISTFLGFIGFRLEKEKQDEAENGIVEDIDSPIADPESLETLLGLELVELEVGYGLVNLVDQDQSGDLLDRISHIRKQFALEWGVIIPSIRIKDNLELRPGGYSLKIKGIEVAQGELRPDHFLALDPGTVLEKIEGIDTVEPVFNLPALWIVDQKKEEAQYQGYTVVDLSTILATHITEILKNSLPELFGRQELAKILDNLKEVYPKILSDLIPDILSTGSILKVLQNLLNEKIPIRDLRTILECLAENGVKTKDTDLLTELVRQSLYRVITDRLKNQDGEISVYTLDPKVEETMAGSLIQTDQGQQMPLDSNLAQGLLGQLHDKMEEATSLGEKMVILCSPLIRRHIKKTIEKFLPQIIVVGHDELSIETKIKTLGTIRV